MLVFTPIDPLFVLLASTWRHRERSMSLYDLLSQDHNSWLTQVATCTSEKIRLVCDVQPNGGDDGLENLFIKANEAKTLKWLSAKVSSEDCMVLSGSSCVFTRRLCAVRR